MKNDCQECKDRYPGCHVVCDKYARYKAISEERRKKLLDEKELNRLMRRNKK